MDGTDGAPGAVGPQGPTGATGPTGPQGEPGAAFSPAPGSITSEMIADGAIIRGKLARESVLPENRGRSNSVRSFSMSFGMSPNNVHTPYVVPAGKTFIVTDVVAFKPVSGGTTGTGSMVSFVAGTSPRAYVFAPETDIQGANFATTFAAGIRFDSGEELTVSSGAGVYATISGYEY